MASSHIIISSAVRRRSRICSFLWLAVWFTCIALLPRVVASTSLCAVNATLAREALAALYNSTDGLHWFNSTGWLNDTVEVEDWFGVSCRGSTLTLHLPKNNVRGTLPAVLGNLTLLELDLSDNDIGGSVPRHLPATLTKLELQRNRFSGTLPEEWANMFELQRLDLGNNRLHGTLHERYAVWVSLTSISVKHNNLSGTLPPAFSNWTRLEDLSLTSNNFSGTLSSSFNSWTQLTHLEISSNNFNGTIPDTFNSTSFLKLDVFDISMNYFTGALPVMWCNTNLRQYLASYNGFTGVLPSPLCATTSLTSFRVSNNALNGTLPPEYSSWPIKIFDVSNNRNVSGTLPAAYREWTSIRQLLLQSTLLRGSIPRDYCKWQSVSFIDLSRCQFSGSLTVCSNWSNLGFLSVAFNNFSGRLPAELFRLTSLRGILACHNHFQGPIPATCSLPFIIVLMLNNNNLSGTLPAQCFSRLGRTLFFAAVTLDNNLLLEGSVPSSASPPMAISTCNTSLCGPLPTSWGQQVAVVCQRTTERIVDLISEAAERPESAILTIFNIVAPSTAFAPPPALCRTATSSLSASLSTAGASGTQEGLADVSDALAASVASFGTVALALRRTTLITSLLHCNGGTSRLGDDVGVSNAPLQLRIGAATGSYHRGAVIGNVACWIVTAVCAGAAIGAYMKFRAPPRGATWASAAAALRLPGGCIVCVVLLLQQTVVSSTLLVSTSLTAADTVIGVLGLVAVLALLGVLLYVLDPRSGRFSATAREVHHQKRKGVLVYVGWRRTLLWLVGDRVVWTHRRRRSEAPLFVPQFGLLFGSCRRHRHWWLVADLGVTVVVSIVVGMSTPHAWVCTLQVWACAAVSGAWVAATVWLRPKQRPLSLAVAVFSNGMQFVVALMVLIGASDASETTEVVTLSSIVLVALAVACCIAGEYILKTFVAATPPRSQGYGDSKTRLKRNGRTVRRRKTTRRHQSDDNELLQHLLHSSHVAQREETRQEALGALLRTICKSCRQ